MAKEKKKSYINTTIDTGLLKQLKLLAVELDKKQNELLEEAIKLLLEKYKEKERKLKGE